MIINDYYFYIQCVLQLRHLMSRKESKPMDAAITFVLSADDKARIKRFAKAEVRTVSNWVRAVVEAELKRREEQAAAQAGRK